MSVPNAALADTGPRPGPRTCKDLRLVVKYLVEICNPMEVDPPCIANV